MKILQWLRSWLARFFSAQKQLTSHEPSLVLGTTGEGKPFALSGEGYKKHKWILGTTGAGKSSFLASLIVQLYAQGTSVCVLDPHGDLVRLVLSLLASSGYFKHPRAYEKLLYVDFNHTNEHGEYDAAIPFNILAQSYQPHTIASNLLEAMHRAFPVSATTANLDTIIQMACLVLIQNKRPFTDINRLILDQEFRELLLHNVTNPLVKQFFALKFSETASSSLVDSTLKRSYLMSYAPALRYPLCQRENTLDFRFLMDTQISLLCNLSGLDDQTRRLLGGLVMTGLEQAFLSRANIPHEKRYPYHIFADEFQLWMANSEVSFSRFMEECRKYGGVLYCAHQTLGQLPTGIANSLQNCVPLVMKAGYLDSNQLTQNFYRPVALKPKGFFDRLFALPDETQQNAFAGLTTKEEARAVFENQQRSEALVTVNGITTRILTNTIPPVAVPDTVLKAIEDTYAKKCLTPVSEIQLKEAKAEKETITPFPSEEEREERKAKRAKRRVD